MTRLLTTIPTSIQPLNLRDRLSLVKTLTRLPIRRTTFPQYKSLRCQPSPGDRLCLVSTQPDATKTEILRLVNRAREHANEAAIGTDMPTRCPNGTCRLRLTDGRKESSRRTGYHRPIKRTAGRNRPYSTRYSELSTQIPVGPRRLGPPCSLFLDYFADLPTVQTALFQYTLDAVAKVRTDD